MRRGMWLTGFLLMTVVGWSGTLRAAEAPPQAAGSGGQPPATPGRFELVVVPNHPGSPFLLDTGTGCLWHQVQHQDTKRTFFIEVDVENLHWSWGSGAQGALANRIDASNLTTEQKNALKENLQKTSCGLSNVVLTPGPPQPAQTPEKK